jgi:phage terminase small subunit
LLANVAISKAIGEAQQKALADAEVTVERVVREYAMVAFLDPGDLFDRGGRLLPISQIPEGPRRALAAFETQEAALAEEGTPHAAGATKRVRFLSKLAALHALAKHLGMFADRPDSGSYGLTIHMCQDSEEHVDERPEERSI